MAKSQIAESPLLIAHLADTHLRDSQYATARRGVDFFEACKAAVKAACRQADLLVLVGDIFDRARPSARVIGQLIQLDQILKEAGKPMLAVTGNHDWCEPTWLSTLFPDRLVDNAQLADDASGIIPIDGTKVTFRGYKFVGIDPHNAGAFRQNLAQITVEAREADVVLYHGLVDGVVPFDIYIASPLHVRDFPVSKNNKAWLLGDIHMQGYQGIPRPGGGECLVGYPGSTEMCSAAEPVAKSVPLLVLTKESMEQAGQIAFPTRPYIQAEIHTEAQLDTVMEQVQAVADQHPVVVVQFSRELPQTINRLHATLDAQRAVIRCYPLPGTKQKNAERETDGPEGEELGMAHFVSKRFEGRTELQDVALALLDRGESDAEGIIAGFIEKRLAAVAVREDEN